MLVLRKGCVALWNLKVKSPLRSSACLCYLVSGPGGAAEGAAPGGHAGTVDGSPGHARLGEADRAADVRHSD